MGGGIPYPTCRSFDSHLGGEGLCPSLPYTHLGIAGGGAFTWFEICPHSQCPTQPTVPSTFPFPIHYLPARYLGGGMPFYACPCAYYLPTFPIVLPMPACLYFSMTSPGKCPHPLPFLPFLPLVLVFTCPGTGPAFAGRQAGRRLGLPARPSPH